MSNERVNCHVFVDFDGTIVPADVTDTLFGRHALPEWLDIEADWKAGRIGSRECMARQVDLLRATPEAYDAVAASVDVDPDFPAFVELCRSRGIGLTVVSDGLDRSILNVLGRAGLDLPFYANRLEHLGGDRWRLGFPHARTACTTMSGNCKCQFTEAYPAMTRIMIGDGRSDFCISGRVDFTFAKGALTTHCRDNRLPHLAVAGFADVVDVFGRWLERTPAGSRLEGVVVESIGNEQA